MTKHLLSVDNTEQNVINVAKDFIDYYKNEYDYSWATIAVIKTDEMPALTNITYSLMEQSIGFYYLSFTYFPLTIYFIFK